MVVKKGTERKKHFEEHAIMFMFLQGNDVWWSIYGRDAGRGLFVRPDSLRMRRK